MEVKFRNPKIYIVAGKARHGKDLAAKMIEKYYEEKGLKSVSIAYADDIKEYAKKIIDWDGSEATKPREFLQRLGTDIVRREIDNLFFVNRLCEDIKVYSYFFDAIIISDARFPFEIDIPKAYFKNVKSINIFRPDFDNMLTEEEKKHPSETGLDGYQKYDYKVINSGTIEDLNKKIIDIIEEEIK